MIDPNRFKKAAGLIILALVVIAGVFLFSPPSFLSGKSWLEEKPLTTVIAMAKAKEIRGIVVSGSGRKLTVYPRVGNSADASRPFMTRIDRQTDLMDLLEESGVDLGPPTGVDVFFRKEGSLLGSLIGFLPLILFSVLILFIMRRFQGGGGLTGGLMRSGARLSLEGSTPTTRFHSVAGVDEAKAELQEVVDFLIAPQRFLALGARIPKGVLLVGQPGTGKTLLARAVAGEASIGRGAPVLFFSISGSEFVEMYVGVGAARVRDLFKQAKSHAPCIIFIDEIDAMGRRRGAGIGSGNDEREQTLNQLLVEMDGFETNTNIIVLAATNRPDILDPALLRPGRFDRRVTLDLPDTKGREAILAVHAGGKPLAPEVTLGTLAKETPGFTGADLANLVNEAAILAARFNKKAIFMTDFEEAVERITAGPERKSRAISPREKEMIAYHEAGHALVALNLPHADRVHKISIVTRTKVGGRTSLLPDEDRHLWTKNQFQDTLAVAMGGRVAEELIFNEVTTGASDDLEKATKTALDMIKRYGMSEEIGPRVFGKREEFVFLGREVSEHRDYGDKVAGEIDMEVKKLITMAYQRAGEILKAHKPKLVRLAEYLIEHETISGDNLSHLLNDKA